MESNTKAVYEKLAFEAYWSQQLRKMEDVKEYLSSKASGQVKKPGQPRRRTQRTDLDGKS